LGLSTQYLAGIWCRNWFWAQCLFFVESCVWHRWRMNTTLISKSVRTSNPCVNVFFQETLKWANWSTIYL
jgi:hypothetical protein